MKESSCWTPADHPNPNLLREGISSSPSPYSPRGCRDAASTLATESIWGPGQRGGVGRRGSLGSSWYVGGGGAGCVPCVSLPATPTMGQALQCQQSPGPRSQSIHQGVNWWPQLSILRPTGSWGHTGRAGQTQARPRHCVQLTAGSPCPPPCLALSKTLLCTSRLASVVEGKGAWEEHGPGGCRPSQKPGRPSRLRKRERVQGTARVTPPFCPAPSPRSCPRLHQALGGPAPCTLDWTADHLGAQGGHPA